MQLIPAAILPGLLDVALRGQMNLGHLFEQVGISHDMIGRDNKYITLAQLDRLLVAAFDLAVVDEAGLWIGSNSHPGNLGLLGQLMVTASTIEDSLDCLFRFKDLLAPFLQFSLQKDGQVARLVAVPDDSLQFTRTRIYGDTLVSAMVTLATSLSGGNFDLLSVSFRHEEPANLSVYRQLFDGLLCFSCPADAVAFRQDNLARPLPGAYPKYHQSLRQQAEQQLQFLQKAQGVAGQLQKVLVKALDEGQVLSVDEAAAALCVTPRTLQRRLQNDGLTFLEVRDRLRHKLACQLLLADECDMGQVAVTLGFSEVANFHHAFRRWQGETPGKYRQRYRPAD